MAEIVIVSGSGDYQDPWHDFAGTSRRLAEVLGGAGHRVSVTEAVEATLAEPGEPDLLVVNIGDSGRAGSPAAVEAAEAGLRGHLDRGGALLGIHASATAMPSMAGWSELLGGRWVRAQTMHPELGEFTVVIRSHDHPIGAELSDFAVVDERYCFLHIEPGIAIVAEHLTEDQWHPIVWTRESGSARVAYSALGHDLRSYDSAGHLELLRSTVDWLLRRPMKGC